jgi:acyl-coenzyme A thioesterase PaaI-like protein
VDDFGEAGALADELRRLIETLQVTDVPDEDLEAIAADVRIANGRLAQLPRRVSWYAPDGPDTEGVFDLAGEHDRSISHVHRSPVTGRLNPAAPPLSITTIADDGDPRSEGTVTFTATHEGAPGVVHGAWIAGVLDEVLAWAQPLSGVAGFTGTINVRYRAPAPTYTPLHLTGRVDRVEGRKIFVAGTCEADGTLVAEADAVFIAPARN